MKENQAHNKLLKDLQESQNADHDNREMLREADVFANKRDGQWEAKILNRFRDLGRPRYTFDNVNPIIDDICSEMDSSQFQLRVVPAGNDATKELAIRLEGMVRNIENISGASYIFSAAARYMVTTGMDGWRVVNDFRDQDSFDQDLLIKKVPNFGESVWYDTNAVEPDMSDAFWCVVLTSMTRERYRKMFGKKASGTSVGNDDNLYQSYYYKKPNEIVIGEYLYKKKYTRELALLSNGKVVEIDDEFERVKDDMQRAGIEVVRTREREAFKVYQQLFDGGDWLEEKKETVFSYLPIIPVFGNFKISEQKVIYWGVVERLMDAQRILNYAESRKIEEGALSPRGKYWMTKDQAKSVDVRKSLRTLNINTEPVQFYDWAEGQALPAYQGTPPSNPNLVETAAGATNYIQRTSGTFDEARGNAPSQRSGVAVELLQNKSDNPKRKWFTFMEIALRHTAHVIIDAIPRVYDTRQEIRIIGEDGTLDQFTIKEQVTDEATGEIVEINDLSQGTYDVSVTAGPAFHNRQRETVATINEIATIDPSIMEIGSDILLNSITSPGIDKLAERKRALMLQGGVIPPSQMTEEETQAMEEAAAQKQEPEMSPLDQANLMIAQAQAQDVQGKNQERQVRLQLEQQKAEYKTMELQVKAQLEQQKFQYKNMELQVKAQIESAKIQTKDQENMVKGMQAIATQIKTQAETLKLIREGLGADAIISPPGVKAFHEQAANLDESITTQ